MELKSNRTNGAFDVSSDLGTSEIEDVSDKGYFGLGQFNQN